MYRALTLLKSNSGHIFTPIDDASNLANINGRPLSAGWVPSLSNNLHCTKISWRESHLSKNLDCTRFHLQCSSSTAKHHSTIYAMAQRSRDQNFPEKMDLTANKKMTVRRK